MHHLPFRKSIWQPVLSKYKRAELYFHLANIFEELKSRHEAAEYLAICLQEYDATRDAEILVEINTQPIMAIVSQAQLKLTQWALNDRELPRAKYPLRRSIEPPNTPVMPESCSCRPVQRKIFWMNDQYYGHCEHIFFAILDFNYSLFNEE
jgi:hypothetical protein